MSTVASLVARLGLDASDFNRGLDDAEGKAHGLKGAIGSFSNASLLAIGVGAGAAAAGIASAIGTAATFEHTISGLGAVSGATKEQLGQLSDKALQLGADTAFGATEAAQAMAELAAQGVPVEAILNGAADAVVALAAAGGTDLVTAATAASTAMGIWKLESGQMVDVVNRLTGAANVSAFGVEDMTQGMAAGGIAAATFGISMEDTTTALAALSKGGFQSGSDAGTSFKAMLLGLGAPMGAGADAIGKLGINVRDAGGKMLPVSGIIQELHSKLDGLGQEDRDEAMARIFGTDGMRAAAVMMTYTGDEFEAMSATMAATDATAIAAQRMDNFKGAMDQVSGSIETVKIRVGLALLPVLTTLAMFMAGAIPTAFEAASAAMASGAAAAAPYVAMGRDLAQQVGSALMPKLEAFSGWFTGNQDAMMAAGAAVGGILVAAFLGLGVAAAGAAVSVLVALAPIIAITAAAALLGAGIYLLVTHWDEVTAAFPPAAAALEAVKASFDSFVSWVTGTFIPLFSSLASAVRAAGSAAVTFVTEHWDQIAAIIGAAGALIFGHVQAVFGLIASYIEGTLQIITGIINVVLGVLTGDWSRAWDGIKGIAEGIWTIISGLVAFGIAEVSNLITNGGALLSAAWSLIWDVLDDMLAGAWENIKGTVRDAIGAVPGIISAAAGLLNSAAMTAWNGIKDGASAVWGIILAWVMTLPGLAGSAISAGAGLLLAAGTAILQAMWDGATAVWATAVEWVTGLPGLAGAAIVAGVGFLLAAGKALLQNAWDGAVIIWTLAVAWVTGLPALANAALLLGVGLLLAAGKALITGLWDGAVSLWLDTVAWISGLPAKAVSAFGNAGQILYGVGSAIIGGLWDGMKSMFGTVQDGLGDLTSKLTGWKGPPATDAVLLEPNGRLIIGGLIAGMESRYPEVKASLTNLTNDIREQVVPIGGDIGTSIGAAMTKGLWDELTNSGTGWQQAADAAWDDLTQWQKQILETLHFTQVAIQNGWDVDKFNAAWKQAAELPFALNEFGRWVATRDFQDSLGIWHTAGSVIDDATVAMEKARTPDLMSTVNGQTAVSGWYRGYSNLHGNAVETFVQGPGVNGEAWMKYGENGPVVQTTWDYAKQFIGQTREYALAHPLNRDTTAEDEVGKTPGGDFGSVGPLGGNDHTAAGGGGIPVISVNGSALLEQLLHELNEAAIAAGLNPLVEVA